jgi:hypothetical protein
VLQPVNRTVVETPARLRESSAIEPKHCDRFRMALERVLDVTIEQRIQCSVRIRPAMRGA